MKRIGIAVLSLIFLVLTACGGEASPASTDSQKTYTLKLNNAFSPPANQDTPAYVTELLAQEVEKRSNGRLKIEIFYGGQLASIAESFDALAAESFDIAMTTPSGWVSRVPEGGFYSLPFWNYGEDHAHYLWNESDVGKIYYEKLAESGIIPLFHWHTGVNGYMGKYPIESVADLKGRVVNSNNFVMNELLKAAGAGISNIPVPEHYEALMRGTTDIIQNSFYTMDTYKFHEVIDYFSIPIVGSATVLTAMNKASYDKLPEDLQKILTEVAAEMQLLSIEKSKKMTENTYDFAKEHDVEFVPMSEQAFNEFVKFAQDTAWKIYAENNDRTKKITEILIRENEKWLKDNPGALEAIIDPK